MFGWVRRWKRRGVVEVVEALGGGRKKEVGGRGAKKEEGSYGKDSHTTGC